MFRTSWDNPPTPQAHYALGKDTRNRKYSRVIRTGPGPTSHGVNTQPLHMTAVTPVASRKTRSTVDFNASPLSDRTRRLFPSIPGPQAVPIIQDDEGEFPSSSRSAIVLLRAEDQGEDASTSSPIISINNDDLKEGPPIVAYRSTKDLPHELETHCNIYLEERLYDKAIILLNNLLVSGTSYPNPREAWLPPKNQVAFITTLLVHPTFTTRATSTERADVSSQALILLRNILSLLGPSKAKLYEAFAFRSKLAPRRYRHAERAALPTSQHRVPYGEEPINSKLANEGSLWLRAQDFWQVVGWAFNCSIHHRGRWNVWKIWLEYMLDVLEADWNDTTRVQDDGYTRKRSVDPEAMENVYQNCIFTQYISDGARSSTAIRRIVKSIFADGTVDALKSYPEVFRDEIREANAKTGTKRKREVKLNLDEDDYGDYMQNDDDDNTPGPSQSDISSPSAVDDSSNVHSIASIAEDSGAMTIRLRLLALLSLASFTAPSLFVPIRELYKFYVEAIKPLPLPAFALFISPSAMPHLPLVALSSIVQAHLSQLLPGGAPRPDDDVLTQMNLERCFLPFAANTSSVEDNAKVSLLVETLFRLLATHGGIEYTPELMVAVEKGVNAREKKCKGTRKKKFGSSKDDEDMYWLKSSAVRMNLLLGQHEKAS